MKQAIGGKNLVINELTIAGNTWKIIAIAVLFSIASVLYVSWLVGVYDLEGKLPRSGSVLLVVLVVVATLIFHELLHFLIYRLYGGKPKFGIQLMARVLPVFTTSSKGLRVSPFQAIMIGSAPLIVISVISTAFASIPIATAYAVLSFTINLIGSSADVYLICKILRFVGRPLLVEDTENGFNILTNIH